MFGFLLLSNSVSYIRTYILQVMHGTCEVIYSICLGLRRIRPCFEAEARRVAAPGGAEIMTLFLRRHLADTCIFSGSTAIRPITRPPKLLSQRCFFYHFVELILLH